MERMDSSELCMCEVDLIVKTWSEHAGLILCTDEDLRVRMLGLYNL